jgi:hypothetical protein
METQMMIALTTALGNGAANIELILEDPKALARAAGVELERMGYRLVPNEE